MFRSQRLRHTRQSLALTLAAGLAAAGLVLPGPAVKLAAAEAAGETATLVDGLSVATKAVTAGEAVTLRFDIVPATTAGTYTLTATPLSGNPVTTWTVAKAAGSARIEFTLGALAVGYYDLALTLGGQVVWPGAHSVVVVPAGDQPAETRFGIDAGPSWTFDGVYANPANLLANATRTAQMLRLAGIGSVRDRMDWWQVQGLCGAFNWQQFPAVARILDQAGLEVVQMWANAPNCSKDPDVTSKLPLDYDKLFAFGQEYARILGPYTPYVEYWNEPNLASFSTNYPFQYANGLKAFTAGVKSVNPDIQVLIGAEAGATNPEFMAEVYANGVASFIAARNQHYYGDNATWASSSALQWDDFYQRNFATRDTAYGVDQLPGWITERGFAQHYDPAGVGTRAEELQQAEFLVKTYALGFATGYERVFGFFWPAYYEPRTAGSTPNVEWGITRLDGSPRPAYLAIALLTRFLEGAQTVALERHGDGRTVYFERPDGVQLAITWGGNGSVLAQAAGFQDVFGQPLTLEQARAAGGPVLVSGIGGLPSDAQAVTFAPAASSAVGAIWLESRVFVDNQEVVARPAARYTRPQVQVGQTMAVTVKVHQAAMAAIRPDELRCLAGAGLAAQGPTWDGNEATCRFIATGANLGQSYAAVEATQGGQTDITRVGLDLVPAPTANPVLLTAGGGCPGWRDNWHSGNTSLSVTPDSTACTAVARITVNQPSDNTWVFPSLVLAAADRSQLDGQWGLRLRFVAVEDAVMFPALDKERRELMIQLDEAGNAGRWVAYLERQADGSYVASFATAWNETVTDRNGRLDLGAVQEIMIGWAGGPPAGASYAYQIEPIELLSQAPPGSFLLKPNGTCPEWSELGSSNVSLTVVTGAGPGANLLCPVSVLATINQPSGNTWVAPAVEIPESYRATLAASAGLRVQLSPIAGQGLTRPPGAALTIQVIEAGRYKWVANVPRAADGSYSLAFNAATNDAISAPADPNGRLDLDQVTKIMVSWGSTSRWVGQTAFRVESVELLVPQDPDPVSYTRLPRVTGQAVVGSTLGVDVAVGPVGTTLEYQWFKGTAAVTSRGGSAGYLVKAADGGADLVCKVWATGPGGDVVVKYSDHVKVFGVANVAVVGTPRAGQVLTAEVAYGPAQAVVLYQWFRGTSVVGTGPSYRVQAGDVDRDLVLKVTVSAAGFGSVVKYSAHFTPMA
ncbi:MAG: hypothetical protein LBR19_08435 [Bifidobacteriaceae bacterium]|jgi:hypothetical protein|nr:hypothetical protein [Bifidobacteriaceae bacterium]